MQLIGGPPRPHDRYWALLSSVPDDTGASDAPAGAVGVRVALGLGNGGAAIPKRRLELMRIVPAPIAMTSAAAINRQPAADEPAVLDWNARNGTGKRRTWRVVGRAAWTAPRTCSGNGVVPSKASR